MLAVSLSDALANVLVLREKVAKISTNPRAFFVHVRVPEDVAGDLRALQRKILPDARQHADIDHATLVYTQKPVEDHDPEKVHAAVMALRQVGERTEPIHAKLQGWAYFDNVSHKGEPATALVALLDAPGLEHLHVDMSRALTDLGVHPSTAHVFTPHVTMGFLPHQGRVDGELPPLGGRFTIDKVYVAARDHHEVPLTGVSWGQKAAVFSLEKTAVGTRQLARIQQAIALKHAAPIDELQAGFRRLRMTRVPVKSLAKAEVFRGQPSSALAKNTGAGATVVSRAVQRGLFEHDGVPRTIQDTPAFLEIANQMPHGQILVPHGVRGSSGVLNRSLGIDVPPVGRRGFNVGVGLHEGFERGVKPDELAPIFSHASPKVLLNEHNMLARMTGPGSDETRAAFKLMRANQNEEASIRRSMMNYYGPRASEFLRPDMKVPAAMRRDFIAKQHARAFAPKAIEARVEKSDSSFLDAVKELFESKYASLGEHAAAFALQETPERARGMTEELKEHKLPVELTAKLVGDHLQEDPHYYTRQSLGEKAALHVRT